MHCLITRTSLRQRLRPCSTVRTWRFQPSEAPKNTWKRTFTTNSPILIQGNSPRRIPTALNVGKRLFKVSFIGLALLGVVTGCAFEGAHIWVEKRSLAPDPENEVKNWQWESDADRWTGDPESGGTDPGLGIQGRHLVRAAWMAYTSINPQLQLTEHFLRSAIRLAESTQEGLYPHTLPHLLVLHGTVLEKLGRDSLPEAQSDFERAWAGSNAKGLDAARIALKLGDIVSRSGSGAQALEWWTRALQLITGQLPKSISGPKDLVPEQAPSSPLAQRLLSSTLVSLSAFYAKSGQYRVAELIEERALSLLRTIPLPDSLASASPPQALHALFILQRSAILSIHLAEVKYAQRSSPMSSMQWLTFAAESSERVARALTGLPLVKPAEFHHRTSLPHPLEERLLTAYLASRSMEPTAKALLRDARRTAAEAWNLMGILHEAKEGLHSKSALQCFERAVEWAGSPSSGNQGAAEGIPDADWRVIWSNYQRAKTHAN